ncbi:hypothetical protein IVB30_31145 [Bradyrhizobium sp. 200]|uniref:hypothetical protein n=1 Tax=Bradyrhizobium sp. 200 TaxID=2782665 RepID=UPI001FFF5314|nr:hypothetical protein [Bradyrhizobium sp. 200]UPJ47683.1 hypothetical protein IVB30_31145 [Bradyrhizobium sp. 200]
MRKLSILQALPDAVVESRSLQGLASDAFEIRQRSRWRAHQRIGRGILAIRFPEYVAGKGDSAQSRNCHPRTSRIVVEQLGDKITVADFVLMKKLDFPAT